MKPTNRTDRLATKRLFLLIVLLAFSALAPPMARAVGIAGQGTWQSTLQPRDLDGDPSTVEAYYDVELDITWLVYANLTGIQADWLSAIGAAILLDVGGIQGWRLPTTIDTDTPGCTMTDPVTHEFNQFHGLDCGYNIQVQSELSHMFFITLGNLSAFDTTGVVQPGYGVTNTGPFMRVQSGYYWSQTDYADRTKAWSFDTALGQQTYELKTNILFAWAVHDGDVGAVPDPPTVGALSMGGFGLLGVARRRRDRRALDRAAAS